MNAQQAGRRAFFEPWSLGDLIIAASALRELAQPPALACHSMWHPLLRGALTEISQLDLIPVDLSYTTRDRANPFDTGLSSNRAYPEFSDVFSIRGDYRDFVAARRLFPRASRHMNGWVRFFGRKSAIVNLPYSLGLLPVENRYRSWARLARVPIEKIETGYRQRQAKAPVNGRVAIHVGAQWRSKQFPHVVELRTAFSRQGWTVTILAGPTDPLPPALQEEVVSRVADQNLIDELRAAEHVITNDSGPMHLAAFLGCRTTAVVRTSPIEEWAPPEMQIVRSEHTPRGYRPHRRYMSDEVLPGWPTVHRVVAAVKDWKPTSA